MNRFDVTIIGAGLAGLQCARLLARRGFAVLLADRKEDLGRAIHTTGIFVRRTLEDFDLSHRLLGPPVRHVVLWSPAGRRQVLESAHEEFRVGRMRELYDELLQQAIRAGVVWRPRTSFVATTRTADGEIVHLEEGGITESVTTRFVVGADGARSRVAEALGLSVNVEFISGVEEVLEGVELQGPPALHCFLDPTVAPGYIGWAAHDGLHLHLGAGGATDRFRPADALTEIRRRAEVLFDLSAGRFVERRGGLIPVGGILPQISCARGLLIGDAAGAVSPLTAGGLDGAMRLSRFAADVLGAALEVRDASLLSLYSGDDFRTRFMTRRWMRNALSINRSRLLTEAACALLRTTFFSRLAQHVFFGRGSFPEPDRTRLHAATLRYVP